MTLPPDIFEAPHGPKLAYHCLKGRGPGFVWMGGFRSDMTGGKATTLHDWAEKEGRAFLRFDYSGHGASSGAFEDGCIGDWLADTLSIIDALTDGPQILVGSSMGGWLALLAALRRPEKLAGLLLIAPAPDFTETLMKPKFPAEALESIAKTGVWMQPSEPYEPTPITKRLLDDGADHLVLNRDLSPITAPVRILQGMKDPDVPWRHALKLLESLEHGDAIMMLVKDGDHSLSRENDLIRLIDTAKTLARDCAA